MSFACVGTGLANSLAADSYESRYHAYVVVGPGPEMRKIVALLLLSALVVGCGSSIHDSKDFVRHSLSQLSKPTGGGDFMWFDVKLTPEYPNDNPIAEEKRMEWLQDWLEVRKLCANGYEILERRPFDFLEHNPGQYDLRYKVQCKVV
jgi:hypothetical protein